MVGHPALVGLLPLVAQRTQRFLHLPSTEGLALGALEQTFGFRDEVLAHLVGTPALPAFEFAGRDQRRMDAGFERRLDELAVFLEHDAQGRCRAGTRLSVAFGSFLLERVERGLHGLLRGSALLGIDA